MKEFSSDFFLSGYMPHMCQNKPRLSPLPIYAKDYKQGAEDKSPLIPNQKVPLGASHLLLSLGNPLTSWAQAQSPKGVKQMPATKGQARNINAQRGLV